MAKVVDSVEALRFALTATKGDPNIRAFEVPRNVAEDILAELDRMREFLRNAREAGENAIPENVQDDLRLAIEKYDRSRATGGDVT